MLPRYEELRAELLLAFQEWGEMLRQSAQYQLGLGRQGSLRTAHLLTRFLVKSDQLRRAFLGQITDARNLPGDLVFFLEGITGQPQLKKVFAEVLRLAQESQETREKLTRLILRLFQALLHKDHHAIQSVWSDFFDLAKSLGLVRGGRSDEGT